MDGRVRFRLEDYRNVEGQFDRIVSVGMFEHVGVGHFTEFFKKVSSYSESTAPAEKRCERPWRHTSEEAFSGTIDHAATSECDRRS